MLLLILILVIFLTLLLFTPKVSKQNERLHELKIEAQEFSGLNPELFKDFLNNMTLFEESLEFPDLSSKYLYQGIDALERMALYTTSSSVNAVETVHEIVKAIGMEAELMILESAMNKGLSFRPTYLNNMDDFYIE
tara:strand:- start:2476 stop:2883 length:408 start_codon:yes stop_codon:yes gene_type:complete